MTGKLVVSEQREKIAFALRHKSSLGARYSLGPYRRLARSLAALKM